MSLSEGEPYPMDLNSLIQVSTLQCEIEKLVAQYAIPRDNLSLSFRPSDIFADAALLRLIRKVAYIPGEQKVVIPRIMQPEISVPATWWDHLKADHLKFLTKWFPVRYTILQDFEIIQFEQTYEARAYLPSLPLGPQEHRFELFYR